MNTERNLGIDLLRIVSMLMVCLLHILGAGGILASCEAGSLNYALSWLLNALSFGAVNIYAMISGYVGVNSRHKIKSIITLWLSVLFYSVLITLIVFFLEGGFDLKVMLKNAFFPVCTGQYWYFTAYFLLFFFMPVLNAGIRTADEKTLRFSLIALFIILCFLPRSFERDIFLSADGYSFLWLAFMYVLGGYIKIYEPFKNIKGRYLILAYLLLSVASFLPRLFFSERYALYLISYMSPTVVLGAVCLVLAFSKMKIGKGKRVIKFFAPLSFSVYLIHTHPLVFSYFLSGAFSYLAYKNAFYLTGGAVLGAVLIYLLCAIADLPRHFLLRLFKK